MTTRDEVICMIEEERRFTAPILDSSSLYTDLGLDSLTFISLLLEIEKRYSIAFNLLEIETCVQVGHLIALTDKKRKKRAGDSDTTEQSRTCQC